jgi:hypothetical protein
MNVDSNKKSAEKEKTIIIETISWKNPDAHKKLKKWGDDGEYFDAIIKIDHTVGKGIIELLKP